MLGVRVLGSMIMFRICTRMVTRSVASQSGKILQVVLIRQTVEDIPLFH
jgi:hypothetical protein